MHRALSDRRIPWAAVIVMSLVTGWLRYRFLALAPEPVGIDGYYYPIQVRSLIEDGHLYYPSVPLVLWLMRSVAALTGDIIVAVKLTAAFGTALIGLPVMGICRATGARAWPSAAAAIAATTAATSQFLAAEFVMNGVGLTLCALFLWAVARALDSNKNTHIAAALAALLAVALAHKLALVIAVVVAVPAVIAASNRRRVWIAIAAAGIAGLAIAGEIWPQRLPSLSSLSLVAGMWTRDYSMSCAVFDFDGETVMFGGDVLLGAIISLAIVAVRVATKRSVPALVIALAAWTLLVANPFIDVSDPESLGPRLRMTAFLTSAPCAAWLIHIATDSWRAATRIGVCLGIAVGILVGRANLEVEGVTRPHRGMLASLERLPDELVAGRVVIVPERALVFATVWVRRTPAQLRPESVAPEKRLRLLPVWWMNPDLSTAIRAATADPPSGISPPLALDPAHELMLVAVLEPTWEWLLTQVPPDRRAKMIAWPTI